MVVPGCNRQLDVIVLNVIYDRSKPVLRLPERRVVRLGYVLGIGASFVAPPRLTCFDAAGAFDETRYRRRSP